MAVSYKQRQEEQVRLAPSPQHTPPSFGQFPSGPIWFQLGGGGAGFRAGNAPSGKAISGSSAGGRVGVGGRVNVQRYASVARQPTASAWSRQRSV